MGEERMGDCSGGRWKQFGKEQATVFFDVVEGGGEGAETYNDDFMWE